MTLVSVVALVELRLAVGPALLVVAPVAVAVAPRMTPVVFTVAVTTSWTVPAVVTPVTAHGFDVALVIVPAALLVNVHATVADVTPKGSVIPSVPAVPPTDTGAVAVYVTVLLTKTFPLGPVIVGDAVTSAFAT